MKKKTLKNIFSRSVWTMFSIFFLILMLIAIVGGNIAFSHDAAINGVLNLNPYKQIDVDDGTEEDTEYFKSDYTKSDGSYDDEAMRANSEEVALQAAVEGSVLLWNDEQALPLQENAGVSLFGISQINYAYLGDGSGSMSVTPPESVRAAFQNYQLSLNSELYLHYSTLSSKYKRSHRYAANEAPYSEISSVVDSTIANYNDAAVMIVSRVAGEHYDILPTGSDSFLDDKNYLDLSTTEAEVLNNLIRLKQEGKVKKVVLLINSANPMQFEHIANDFDIDSCVWVGMGGTMSFEQIAAVLSNRGKYTISGHLPDTFVYNNYSHPSQQNFGDFTWNDYSDQLPDLDNQGKETYASFNIKYITYQEGIYVGYRYYETRYEDTIINPDSNASSTKGAVASESGWKYDEEVAFPFGYGLSYTEFDYSNISYSTLENGDYQVSLTVNNTGELPGKDAVQVYIQKPYTEYDVENGIEKASVELVGFEKTGLIPAGGHEDVTITIPASELKTYDSNNSKTYILEKGDYYLSVGIDSHDAINNILAAKGYDESDGMDASGDASYTHRITIKEDDFTIYSTSEVTGNPITNQFDNADLNHYEGTEDQKITYLSRSDWDKTYPSPVELDCLDEKLVYDMHYGHENPADPDDEMPVYNTITSSLGKLTLAMLIDKEYDDPLWEDLLNQMTIGEQQYLISYGLHHIAGAASVAAPGCESKDGPAGLKANNPTLGTTFSYPSEVLLAATFDVDLIEKVGVAFGHEILHADFTAIYAPGGCIHRSPYGGRNWEYFSEDGFLSGKMLSAEVKGLQSKGVIVFTKHFALNDQETNRYGVATWANEQSIREIYLKSFEIAVVEGHMNGVMSSFNRIGCTWAGAHKGMLTNVLRDEWGFLGIVETDSCTGTTDSVHHMTNPLAKEAGLLAGNDMWMDGGGNTEYLKESLDNPTIMLALREACHRILYVMLHSNAMNGISTSTRIIKVRLWWQTAIDTLRICSIIVFTICAVMAVLSFVVATKWFDKKYDQLVLAYGERKNKKAHNNLNVEGDSTGSETGLQPDGNEPPKFDKKKKIIIIASSVVVLIGIILGITLPLTLNRGSNNSSNSSHTGGSSTQQPDVHVCEHQCPVCGGCLDMDCDDPVCAVKCGQDKKEQEFEAEDGKITDGQNELKIGTFEGTTYIGEFNNNIGASVELTVNSKVDTVATLVVRVNTRRAETVFTSNLLVAINGQEFTSPAVVPSTGTGEETWYDFVDVRLGCVNLQEGDNSIKFVQIASGDIGGYNFDKIKLLTDDELTFVEPVYECTAVCPICGKCMDPDCHNSDHTDKCSVDGTRYQFEAEAATLGAGVGGLPNNNVHNSAYPNTTLVGNLSENEGASLSFKVNVKEETTANLIAAVTTRDAKKLFNGAFTITNNGEAVERGSMIPASDPDSPTYQSNGNDWYKSVEVNLGCLKLQKGWNTIVFTVPSTDAQSCVNFDYIVLTSNVEISDSTFAGAEKVGIRIASMPGQLTYYVGDTFNPAGLVVNAVYDDETEVPLTTTEYTYSPMTPLTLDDTKITVMHETFTAEIPITVNELPKNKYRIEAEYGEVTDGTKAVNVNTNFGLLGQLNGNTGASVTLTFNAEQATKATLYVAVNERSIEYRFSDFMKTEVNDVELQTEATSKTTYGVDMWYNYNELQLGEIDLLQGENKIKFTVVTTDDKLGGNFDYISLFTDGEITTSYPDHTCEHKCPTCGKCTDLYCDGYEACEEKCGDSLAYEYRYEAEDAELKNPDPAISGKNIQVNEVSGNMVEGTNGNPGATLTFTVNSSKAQTGTLIAAVSTKNVNTPLFTDVFKVSVNGEDVTSTSTLPMAPINGDLWFSFDEVNIGCIQLTEGENKIVLTATNAATNIDYIAIKSDAELTDAKDCTHKCAICGKCVDPDCTATSCKDKCVATGADHKFMAADAELVNGSKGFKTEANGALGNVDQNKDGTITFKINADEETDAGMILSFAYRSISKKITDGISITINGETYQSGARRPATRTNGSAWNYFADSYLGHIHLNQGENTIVLKVLTDQAYGASNLMYMNLVTDTNLTSLN